MSTMRAKALINNLLQTRVTRRDISPILSRFSLPIRPTRANVVILHIPKICDQFCRNINEICSTINDLGLNCLIILGHDNDASALMRHRAFGKGDQMPLQFANLTSVFDQNNIARLRKSALEFLKSAFSQGHSVVISTSAIEFGEKMTHLSPSNTLKAVVSSLQGELDEFEVEKIIVIDPEGGICSQKGGGSSHLMINLQQEYETIKKESNQRSSEWITTAFECLSLMPQKGTLTLTSPEEAFGNNQFLLSHVLTNRPIVSSSLPLDHLKRRAANATVIRTGYPLQVFNKTSVGLHYHRLYDLLEQVFGRKLNRNKFHERMLEKLNFCIIVGDYEGCAIVTTETTEGWPSITFDYLDKFAVKRSNYGNNNMADVCFSELIKLCSDGLVWRSRSSNPVNAWYFDRSRVTIDLDSTGWRFFYAIDADRDIDFDKLSLYKDAIAKIDSNWM